VVERPEGDTHSPGPRPSWPPEPSSPISTLTPSGLSCSELGVPSTMAKHKAATEISIVTEERSAFAKMVDRYKLHFILGALVVTGVIVFMQFQSGASVEKQREQWKDFHEATTDGSADALQRTATKLSGQPAADWARMMAAVAFAKEGEFGAAREAQIQLANSNAPLLTKLTLPIGAAGAEQSLAQHLEGAIAAREAFRKENARVFENPAPPADAPIAVLDTALGEIKVALYANLAPKHVENFLKLAREDFYDGTKFHRVIKSYMIQGGDPNSRDGAPETWGQGGPGYKVEREESPLLHFPMYLSAAKQEGEIPSSGSQFFITTAAAHHLEGVHVVYGKVIEGESVVRAIEEGSIQEGTKDRPVEPIVIRDVRIMGE
jgi:peptidyl-prolyl cis-trans isomerase B (cyclophilin B)